MTQGPFTLVGDIKALLCRFPDFTHLPLLTSFFSFLKRRTLESLNIRNPAFEIYVQLISNGSGCEGRIKQWSMVHAQEGILCHKSNTMTDLIVFVLSHLKKKEKIILHKQTSFHGLGYPRRHTHFLTLSFETLLKHR